MNIGNNIRRIRLLKNIGQKEICAQVKGLNQSGLSKIESGGSVLWEKVEAIALSLGLSIEELVCFDSNKLTFNLLGDKSKGMVINQNNSKERELQDIIQVLKEENLFLRKMLEKAIDKKALKNNKP